MYRNIKQYPDSEVYPGVLAFRIGEDGSPAHSRPPTPAAYFFPHPDGAPSTKFPMHASLQMPQYTLPT